MRLRDSFPLLRLLLNNRTFTTTLTNDGDNTNSGLMLLNIDAARALGPLALLSDRLVACVCVYFGVSETIAYSAGYSDAFSRGDVRCVVSEGGLASCMSFYFTTRRT